MKKIFQESNQSNSADVSGKIRIANILDSADHWRSVTLARALLEMKAGVGQEKMGKEELENRQLFFGVREKRARERSGVKK